jgi:hypothetical protein
MRTQLTLSLLAFIAITDLPAQRTANGLRDIAPSTRIRVTPVGSSPEIVGRVIEVRGDTLRFSSESGISLKPLHLSQIAALDTSAGLHGRFFEGTLVGLAIGGAVGAVAGALTYTPCTDTGFMACFLHPTSRVDAAGMGMVGGGVTGALIGAIVGAASKAERWNAVIPERSAHTIKPLIGPTRAGLKLRF